MSDINKSLELVVKVLVAAIGGILGLFVLGWVMRGLGGLFLGVAGLLIALLKFIVPVAVIAGIVYFAVSQLRPKTPESRSSGGNSMATTVDVEVKPDQPGSFHAEPVHASAASSSTTIKVEDSSAKQTSVAASPVTVEVEAPKKD
jgi:predicted lipid-binding transport protein (Tim44 family)